MPYVLSKVRGKDLYYVVNYETGKKHSKEPLEKEKAEAQMRALYVAMEGETIPAPVRKAAKEFEHDATFKALREAVLAVHCPKIKRSYVETLKTKAELLDYLRHHQCPILVRIEAELQRKL